MNKEQGNYFRMFLNTQNFLDDKTPVWSAIPKITSYKNDLDEIISRILEKSEETKLSIGTGERKKQLKSSIGMKISSLSGVLQAYAYDIEDIDLANKVKISKSEAEKIRDQDLEATVKMLANTALQNMTELADFGLTNDVLAGILTSQEEFNGMIGKPRNILNSKFVTLDSIDRLFDECNNLLKNKLDKVMLMFRENNPGFYDGYERARVIVDL